MNLKPHKTWNIFDSSKMKEFMRCPRRFFFRYILGWEPEGQNLHLIFGGAWHRSLEALFLGSSVEESYQAGLSYYRSQIPNEDLDMVNFPKVPGKIKEGLDKLTKDFPWILQPKVEAVEVASSVIFNQRYDLTFRLDLIQSKDGEVFLTDHKTTGWKSSAWIDQWNLDFQMHLYDYVMRMSFENYSGKVNVLGFLVYKNSVDFLSIPLRFQPDEVDSWYVETVDYFRSLQFEFDRLKSDSEENDLMLSFPRRRTSCISFNRLCPYADLCASWQNPLQHHSPPPGFTISWWDPRERNKERKEK